MQVYRLRLQDGPGALIRDVDFEAQDDAAAVELMAHYYADAQAELWQGDRLVGRYGSQKP